MRVLFVVFMSISLSSYAKQSEGVYCPDYDKMDFNYTTSLDIFSKTYIYFNHKKIIADYFIYPEKRINYILAALLLVSSNSLDINKSFDEFYDKIKNLRIINLSIEKIARDLRKMITGYDLQVAFAALQYLTRDELLNFINCLELYDEKSKQFATEYDYESKKEVIFYFLQLLILPKYL